MARHPCLTPPGEELLASSTDTVVGLMGLSNIEKIAGLLIGERKPAETSSGSASNEPRFEIASIHIRTATAAVVQRTSGATFVRRFRNERLRK